jgi:two-component system, response regulator PdtaR
MMQTTQTCPLPRLPRFWLAPSSHDREEGETPRHVDPARRIAALKVLIVEDEFFIALDTEDLVKALGQAVVGTAVSADQAIALADREKPDVVLMDIRLGGARDGIDAAAEIRRRHDVDIIFVTANMDSVTLQRARSIDPLAVLQKPLTRARLQEQLANVRARGGRE